MGIIFSSQYQTPPHYSLDNSRIVSYCLIRPWCPRIRNLIREQELYLTTLGTLPTNKPPAQSRLEICQKFYTTGFSSQKIYTLKMPKLRLSYSKRNSVNALIPVILVACLLESNFVCKILTFSVQNHTWCV